MQHQIVAPLSADRESVRHQLAQQLQVSRHRCSRHGHVRYGLQYTVCVYVCMCMCVCIRVCVCVCVRVRVCNAQELEVLRKIGGEQPILVQRIRELEEAGERTHRELSTATKQVCPSPSSLSLSSLSLPCSPSPLSPSPLSRSLLSLPPLSLPPLSLPHSPLPSVQQNAYCL